MVEMTDEYFINLTMKYDERDDEIYPKWAQWCYKSDYRYYIDGKDGQFFTHIRTDDEIAIEKRKREIMEFVVEQRHKIDNFEEIREDFLNYEKYYHDKEFDDNIMNVELISFEQWKETEKNN